MYSERRDPRNGTLENNYSECTKRRRFSPESTYCGNAGSIEKYEGEEADSCLRRENSRKRTRKLGHTDAEKHAESAYHSLFCGETGYDRSRNTPVAEAERLENG